MEILLEKKDLLDKSVEEDEVKEEHVKCVPDWRKYEILLWRK